MPKWISAGPNVSTGRYTMITNGKRSASFGYGDEVERMWASSAEMNLLVSEKRAEGKKIRHRAERLFREAEERKVRGKALRIEADQQSQERSKSAERLAQLMRDAREKFGCAVGVEFLYWRQREDQNGAYCVALIDDPDNYNIEIKPLGFRSNNGGSSSSSQHKRLAAQKRVITASKNIFSGGGRVKSVKLPPKPREPDLGVRGV